MRPILHCFCFCSKLNLNYRYLLLDQVWSILAVLDWSHRGLTSWGGATPMQAKWIKLDLLCCCHFYQHFSRPYRHYWYNLITGVLEVNLIKTSDLASNQEKTCCRVKMDQIKSDMLLCAPYVRSLKVNVLELQ